MVEEIERDNSGDISIHLAAPEMIRSWSHGEVTKPAHPLQGRHLRPLRR